MKQGLLLRLCLVGALGVWLTIVASPLTAGEPSKDPVCKASCDESCNQGRRVVVVQQHPILSKVPYLSKFFKNIGVGVCDEECVLTADSILFCDASGTNVHGCPVSGCPSDAKNAQGQTCAAAQKTYSCQLTGNPFVAITWNEPRAICSANNCKQTVCTTDACSAKACSTGGNCCVSTGCPSAVGVSCNLAACAVKQGCCAQQTCAKEAAECCQSQASCKSGKCCDFADSKCCVTGSCAEACQNPTAGRCPVAKHWSMALEHCPLFSGRVASHECPLPSVRLQRRIKELETMVEVQAKTAEMKEQLMGTLFELQSQAAEQQAEMLGGYMEMVVETMEARADMLSELAAERERLRAEASEVHIANARLEAKLEAAEQKFEMMHALARLQLENQQLKQQVASRKTRGAARNDMPVSAPTAQPQCPVNSGEKPNGEPQRTTRRLKGRLSSAPATTIHQAFVAATNGLEPAELPVQRIVAVATTDSFLIRLQVCEGNLATGEIKKVYCEPTLVTTAGRSFECRSGGEVVAANDCSPIPTGTLVKGEVAAVQGDVVQIQLSMSLSSQCCDSRKLVCVQQLGAQLAGQVRLGEPIKLNLGGSGDQQKWVQINVERARK